MTRPYTKPALTFADQVQRLVSRGLEVADPQAAAQKLEQVSYYRLTAYWHPFKRPDDTFEPGATFDEVLWFYELDRRLRLLVMDAVERTEVHLRTTLAYVLGHAHGPFAHEDPRIFHPRFDHTRWRDKVHEEIDRSHEVFVDHFRKTYDGFPVLPIWAAVETMTSGVLSRLFTGMIPADRRAVAGRFGLPYEVLGSWLHTLTYVRNVCAHHARLWNIELSIPPTLPRKDPMWHPPFVPDNRHIYCTLLILRKLTADHHAADDWARSALSLLGELDPKPRWRNAIGAPPDWARHPLWRL